METRHRSVAVGVSGSDRSLAAVDVAAAEADRRGARLALLAAHPAGNGAGPNLSFVLHRTCATWPGLSVTARNVTGDPAAALIDASRSAVLLVIGRHGPSPALRPDSVTAQVAAHSWCPTLVVPASTPEEAPPPADGPVLLGLGMSPEDEPAIGFAFEAAALRRVPLLAVHVWSGIPRSALGTVSPFAYDLYEAQSVADRTLAETLAGWAEKHPEVTVERMPRYDVNPARALRDASGMAGLLVVGARRESRRSSHLLGTVTRTLLAHAACPVAVVHPARTTTEVHQ